MPEQERFRTRAAVILLLFREQAGQTEILLQRRQNTGYADGLWDSAASGHIEEKESLRQALVREAYEELGITIYPDNLQFVTVIHKFIPELDDAYFTFYFQTRQYSGKEAINEPEKCSELRWFSLQNLPADLIIDRQLILQHLNNGIYYDELGWNEAK
jgi:8-oxo-dGTP pyrophosphatase MutT (NUDIX family)